MTTASAAQGWEEASREVLLTCDADGFIVWADARAERILGAATGMPFSALAVEGAEARARALLEEARARDLAGRELPLVAFSLPSTVCWHTRRGDDGNVHMHGLVLPDAFGSAMRQLSEALHEVMELNREISRQKKQLAAQHDQLARAHRELEESNRGVLNLHAELADRAESLRRTSEVKTRVVANVSHEFRTPLHTILGLSKLLLEASDGPLSDEQTKQVRFIRAAAQELYQIVNELLELSKAESGKALLRPEKFAAEELLAALRGMLRPLVPQAGPVRLVFEPAPEGLVLDTDQSKLAQILRNLISNALKFTERGEVHVGVRAAGDHVVFEVRDTGIGIAERHFERIFEEFGQIESPLQRRAKGTGLGLPLSKKLAELLGGSLGVASTLGRGSTFTLVVPRVHAEASELEALERRPVDPTRAKVLVVEDDRKTIFVYDKYLALGGFQVLPARNVEDARRLLASTRPAAILLDIMLDGESSWAFLEDVKRDPKTRDIPVLVCTITAKEAKARALGADEFWLKPVDKERLLRKLRAIARPPGRATVLVIDDDERARYLVQKLLQDSPYALLEASSGAAGVRAAKEQLPDVILLDFFLQGATAFDVLDELKKSPLTRAIPVIVVTSHALDADERERLAARTESIVSKGSLSRELTLDRIRDALTKQASARREGHGVSDGGSA